MPRYIDLHTLYPEISRKYMSDSDIANIYQINSTIKFSRCPRTHKILHHTGRRYKEYKATKGVKAAAADFGRPEQSPA